jgi:hypothetical protein
MDCSICLDKLKKKDTIFTLSCNHVLHYQCFLSYSLKTKGHIFVKCPLCRELNINNDKPFESPLENIKILCSREKNKVRCNHKTKKGNRCKNNSHVLNYGYCRTHHKEVLPKEKYELMSDYLYYLLVTSNIFRTKIYMLDITKKLLLRYPEITKIDEIQYYFLRYFHYYRNSEDTISDIYLDPCGIYNYYDLPLPPLEWVKSCSKNKIII